MWKSYLCLQIYCNQVQHVGRPLSFLVIPFPPTTFVLIQMLCHRCYLGANFWVNVYISHIIIFAWWLVFQCWHSIVTDIIFPSMLMMYVSLLGQQLLLWWILVVPPFSHFGCLAVNFLSQVNFIFLLFFVFFCFAHIKIPKTREKKNYLR